MNFKNVAHALANRHQRWICYALASGRLVSSPLECGPSGTSGLTHVREETQDIQDKLFHIVPQLNMDASIFRPRWVRRNGILYQCNNAYLITASDGLDPVFSRLTLSRACAMIHAHTPLGSNLLRSSRNMATGV